MPEQSHTTDDKCLNCGEELKGRYCYNCGQDSQEHLDSIWHLIQHFFEDITHYDGKLWKTVRPLLIKPGFLTQEYLKGKRASYLHPVRMFIFLNFIFFFLLLSLPSGKSSAERHDLKNTSSLTLAGNKDTTRITTDSVKKHVNVGNVMSVDISDNDISNREKYDSAQAALPPAKRDGRIKRAINEKGLDFLNSYKKDPDYAGEKINEIFFHNTAKLTFLFIVLCTLLISLLYRRKHLLMTDHALFSIHLSCTFLSLSVVMLLFSYLPFGVYLNFAIFIYGNYYFYRALRNVYAQSSSKTLLKFFIINFCLLVTMLTALVVNGLFALMSVS